MRGAVLFILLVAACGRSRPEAVTLTPVPLSGTVRVAAVAPLRPVLSDLERAFERAYEGLDVALTASDPETMLPGSADVVAAENGAMRRMESTSRLDGPAQPFARDQAGIPYDIALAANPANRDAARAFVDLALSGDGRRALAQHGLRAP